MITINEIAEWFISEKTPDLKDKINAGLAMIEKEEPLQDNYKKLFSFMMFSYSMAHGPEYFLAMEYLAKKVSVLEEMKAYAQDWISHSKKSETTILSKK